MTFVMLNAPVVTMVNLQTTLAMVAMTSAQSVLVPLPLTVSLAELTTVLTIIWSTEPLNALQHSAQLVNTKMHPT